MNWNFRYANDNVSLHVTHRARHLARLDGNESVQQRLDADHPLHVLIDAANLLHSNAGFEHNEAASEHLASSPSRWWYSATAQSASNQANALQDFMQRRYPEEFTETH